MVVDVNSVVRSTEAAALAGITYRQLNHWVSLGYVRASGTTSRQDWAAFTAADVATATALGRCGKAGWSTQHVATQLGALRIGTGPGWVIVTRDNTARAADDAYTATWCPADDLAVVLADDPGPHVLTATDITPAPTAAVVPVRSRRRTG